MAMPLPLGRLCGERTMRLVGQALPCGPRPWPTTLQKRERPGCNPVFQNIGAYSAERNLLRCSVAGLWTDSEPAASVCVRDLRLSSIASTPPADAGDGFQPQALLPQPWRLLHSCCRDCSAYALGRRSRAMSHVA